MNLERFKKHTDYSEVIKKGSIALLIRIIGFLAGYLFIYFTVKYYGAETQGRLSLSFSFMIIGALICRMGIDVNFVKTFAISNNFQNAKGIYFKIIPITAIISLLVSGSIFLFSDFIALNFFDDPGLSPFLKWTAPCIVLFTFILINASVFRGLRMNSLYAFLFNGGRFIFALLFFGLLFLLSEHNSLITVKAHTLSILILFLISIYFIRKYLIPRERNSVYKVKGFIKDSLPMFLSASMIVLLGWSDVIILGIYSNSEIVGIYSVILKIAAVASFTLQAIDSILAPKLSSAYHDGDMRLFKKLIKFSVLINFVFSSLIILGILIFKDFILGVFGEGFYIASLALVILCVGQLFNAIGGPIGSVFQMTGHQRVFQNILIISFIINLTLNILLAPKYGINGVAVATAFSLIFSKVIGVIYAYKMIWNTK